MRREKAAPYDGVVALGCVIQGETYHFEIVSNESARGLMDLTRQPQLRPRQRHPHRRQRSAGARARRRPTTATKAARPRARRWRWSRSNAISRAMMARSAPIGDKDARKANKRGAARLAAVQALYQMDIAGTGLNEILAAVRKPLARPRGRGRAISAGRGRVLPRHRLGRGARAARARSADRRRAGEKLAAQAHRDRAARGVAGRGLRTRPPPRRAGARRGVGICRRRRRLRRARRDRHGQRRARPVGAHAARGANSPRPPGDDDGRRRRHAPPKIV